MAFLNLIPAAKWMLGGVKLSICVMLTPPYTVASVSLRPDVNSLSALSNWKLHLFKMQLPWQQQSSGIFVFWRYQKTQCQYKSTQHDILACAILCCFWIEDGMKRKWHLNVFINLPKSSCLILCRSSFTYLYPPCVLKKCLSPWNW